jgi:hypothetical protein
VEDVMTAIKLRFRFAVVLLPAAMALTGKVASAHEAKHGAATHHAQAKPQGVVSLDIYRDATLLHLLTLDADAKRDVRQLVYRQSGDYGKTWTNPVIINRDSASIYPMTRGNDAQIAASGQRVLAAWTARGSGWEGSGPLATALSVDGGKTWRASGNPADDGTTSGHAYIELGAAQGAFDAVWLDDRDGAQGLRHARSRDGLRWEKNSTVQSKTCECCWQSLTRRDDALLVLFRGKDPRDMRLSALLNSTANWVSRGTVGRFNWDFKGCPHTGGNLAAAQGGKSLHAVVWTGAPALQGLHHMVSRDGGMAWSHRTTRMGSPDARRADIAIADEGKLLAAAWDQLEGSRRLIYAAHSVDEGETWSVPQRLSGADADAVYPRMVAAGRGFLVLWTESAVSGVGVLKTMPYEPRRSLSR